MLYANLARLVKVVRTSARLGYSSTCEEAHRLHKESKESLLYILTCRCHLLAILNLTLDGGGGGGVGSVCSYSIPCGLYALGWRYCIKSSQVIYLMSMTRGVLV